MVNLTMRRRFLLGAILLGVWALGVGQSAQPALATLPVGGHAGPIAVGDLNQDGKLDIVAARVDAGTVAVYLGDGRGRFSASEGSPFAAGDNPEDLALGDFNEDGRIDLVIANHETSYVTVLLGDGRGGFAPAQPARITVQSRPHPHGVAVGDFNGDRHLDIAVESWQDDAVLVLQGNGKAVFAGAPTRLRVGHTPYWKLRAGDLDGDQSADLVTTNTDGSSVSALCADAGGWLQASRELPTARVPFAVAIGDVNGDRYPDLAVAHRSGGPDRTLDGLTVLIGKGNCDFDRASQSAPRVGLSPTAVAIGDFDGDGVGDIAVANMGSDNVTILLGGRSGLRPASASPLAVGKGPSTVALADVNGDGKADVVTGNWASGDVSVVLSR